MKKFLSVLIATLLIVSVFAMSASAISELRETYSDRYVGSWMGNDKKCLGNIFISYDTGLSWWYASDAEVYTTVEMSYEIGLSDVDMYVYAEIRNDYVDHMDSDYVDYVNPVTRAGSAYASIDDVYSTYNHHNSSFKYKNETRQGFPVTYGER